MMLPGFSAETSLHRTQGSYRTRGSDGPGSNTIVTQARWHSDCTLPCLLCPFNAAECVVCELCMIMRDI